MPPVNDNIADAILITGSSGTTTGDNVDATHEAGEADWLGEWGENSVWWKWVCPSGVTQMVFDTYGSLFGGGPSDLDTVLAVWQLESGSPYDMELDGLLLTIWEFNDDTDEDVDPEYDRNSRVELIGGSVVEPGRTYYIQVQGYDSGEEGDIILNWALYVPPPPPPPPWGCCPATNYPSSAAQGMSPSSFHAESRLLIDVAGAIRDLDTNTYVESRYADAWSIEPGTGSITPFFFDHDGVAWYLQTAGWNHVDWGGAHLVSPTTHYVGTRTLTLHRAEDSSTVFPAPIPVWSLERDYAHGEDGVNKKFWMLLGGVDWSPFEDCIYVTVGYFDVPEETYENQLWRIEFDGSYEVLWTIEVAAPESSPNSPDGNATVAADGAVWFTHRDSADTTTTLWRKPYGENDAAEVVLDGGPYLLSHNIGATPWGDVIVHSATTSFGLPLATPLMVSSAGTVTEIVDCGQMGGFGIGSSASRGFLRSEDFSHLYHHRGSTIWEIDWAGQTSSGWQVGSVAF